jgi:cell wall-associated NlpC family hydrolase
MSQLRERFRKFFPVAMAALLALPALLLLTSCHEQLAQAGKPKRTAARSQRPDAGSLSGELRLLRNSGQVSREGVQYIAQAGEAPQAGSGEPLINPGAAIRGLNGRLSTANAGQGLLAADSGSGPKAATTASKYYVDDAPQANKKLRNSQGLTSKLLTVAYSLTGRPHLDGGVTPENGFDDLGFVGYVYSKSGAAILPRDAKGVLSSGRAVTKESLRPGDVLVYRNPRNESRYLLGIYTGNGNFLLASSKQKLVSETAAFGIDYGPYFVGGRRYFEDPGAQPLPDSMKMAATNGAVKQALAQMGDSLPKASYKPAPKRKAPRKASRSRPRASGKSRGKSRR